MRLYQFSYSPYAAKIRIDARYVEAGEDRRGGGNYMLTYRWKDGGILGGRSVRLERLSRT